MSLCLVTGATGFFGGAIVHGLLARGHDVFAAGRNSNILDALPLVDERRKLAFDLGAAEPVRLAEKLGGLDCIIHCAGLSSPWGRKSDFEHSNVRATEKVIALAKACGVRHVIHISTPAIYFRFKDQWDVGEDGALPRPVNEYARSKAVAEKIVRESGLAYTIVRPRGLYGQGDTALLPRLIRAAKAGPLPRFRKGVAATDITHVDDAVDAVITIVEKREAATGKTFNVSGGEVIPIQHIVGEAARASGVEPAWRDVPLFFALAAVRAGEFISGLGSNRPEPRVTAYSLGIFAFSQTLDISRIERHVQWKPRISWDEGFARTFPGRRIGGETI